MTSNAELDVHSIDVKRICSYLKTKLHSKNHCPKTLALHLFCNAHSFAASFFCKYSYEFEKPDF